MPVKKQKAKRHIKKAKKPKSIDTKPLMRALTGMKSVVKGALDEGSAMNPDEHLPSLRDAVQEMQDAVAGFKREIKRRMLADPRLKNGTIRTERAIIHLKLRKDAKQGSKNPDDYEVVREAIQ